MDKNRVVWHEGLFLRPQHLQQQERFLQHWIEGRCRDIHAFSWGITQLELDEQLMTLGKLSINKAQGVFPDGTPFDIPETSPAPIPLQVSSELKNETLFVAIPLIQPNAQLIGKGDDQNALARYRIKDLVVPDLHSEQLESEADLQVGELNIRLVPGNEKLDAFSLIPIARIIEVDKNGAIKLDNDFIPAVMNCDAAGQLTDFISETEGLLSHRGEAIASRLAAPGSGGVSEIADFLLLQLVNRFEPLLHHLRSSNQLHPEELFRVLISLAGELATFTRDERRPPRFPDYIHDQLQTCFEPVMDEIRRALGTVLEQKAIGIEIIEHKYGIWVAQIMDKSLLDTAMFVLAAKADVSSEKIRSKFPNQSTIAVVEKIRELVNSHIPGIEISPLAVAPRQIPYHSGFTYFEIDTHHELWKQLENSGGLAVHVGTKLENLELELWAIRE